MPYIVPQAPPSPGQEFARDLLKQAMLAFITQGASLPFAGLQQVAKAGQYTSPTGAQTMISPAERVASNPSMGTAQLMSENPPRGSSFIPTQFGLGRSADVEQATKRANLGLTQAATGYYNRFGRSPSPSPSPDISTVLQDLLDRSDTDPQAEADLRVMLKYFGGANAAQ